MRTVLLLPLTVLAAIVAGCGSGGGTEQAAVSAPRRDLTVRVPAREVVIASPVELQHLRSRQQPMTPSRRTARRSSPIEPKPAPAAVAAAPAPVLATPDPVARPADTASEPANDRELLPGKTVTLIPASSGPSIGSDWTDELPTARGGTFVVRGGGQCPRRGRRPGIGIAAVPRPHFR